MRSYTLCPGETISTALHLKLYLISAPLVALNGIAIFLFVCFPRHAPLSAIGLLLVPRQNSHHWLRQCCSDMMKQFLQMQYCKEWRYEICVGAVEVRIPFKMAGRCEITHLSQITILSQNYDDGQLSFTNGQWYFMSPCPHKNEMLFLCEKLRR